MLKVRVRKLEKVGVVWGRAMEKNGERWELVCAELEGSGEGCFVLGGACARTRLFLFFTHSFEGRNCN